MESSKYTSLIVTAFDNMAPCGGLKHLAFKVESLKCPALFPA